MENLMDVDKALENNKLWDDNYSLNYLAVSRTKMTKPADKPHRKAFIYLKDFFQVNDRFILKNYPRKVYYIRKFMKLEGDGSKKFWIKRVDGFSIVDTDLNEMTKGSVVLKRGSFVAPACNS